MAIKARIWWDVKAQAYVLSSTFNEKLVDALKQLVPSGDRDWDPANKFWYVKEQYGEFLRTICTNAFGMQSVSFTSKQVAEQTQSYQSQSAGSSSGSRGAMLNASAGTTEDCIVAFFTLLPYDAAKKAYLLGAQTLHPDKPQGDAQKMSKLNELWVRIEKEFFKR